MWYKNSYRRHLIDMHINDWSDEFLSQFDVETYITALKKARIQNAMIYLQSHVGLCNFPTKVGTMHKAFIGKEDTIRRLIDRCHEEGIAVTAYYSLNYNTIEHDKHPDWRMVAENGISSREGGFAADSQAKNLLFASPKMARYGLCCPNSQEYREFTYKQIDEMLAYTGKIEGVFFDMPFWLHTCYCKNCQARYREEFGVDMPTGFEFGDEAHQTIMRKKTDWMGEWIQSVTDYVKKYYPYLSVEHNYAQAIAGDTNSGCAEEVNNACDFVGGDLYGGIIPHSLACKLYKNITKNMPFDYMFSRCKPGLATHTLSKTDDEIRTELFMTTAHNGATLVIDAIDPVGTMDLRFYDKLGKIIDEEIPYEKYLNGKMVEDIGLYFSLMSKFNPRGEVFDNKQSLIAVNENFINNKIPFGVTGNFYTLDGYKAIILPLITKHEKDTDRILDYVKNGGNLYLSGAENEELLFELTGLKVLSRTIELNTYLSPTKEDGFLYFNKKYPLPFNGTLPIVKTTKDVEVLATITLPYTKPDEIKFASIHSNPPGIYTDYPAIIKTTYGKGNVIWSGAPIESVNLYEYNLIFNNLLLSMIPDYKPSFKSTAPGSIEMTLFKDDLGYRLNLINVLELPVSSVVPDFTVSVKTDAKPKKVSLLPDEVDVPFDYNDGYTTFTVKDFKIFNMFRIEV